MSSRYYPPLSYAHYMTTILCVVLFEMIMVVVSNEGQILSDNDVEWYSPFAMMKFANTIVRES